MEDHADLNILLDHHMKFLRYFLIEMELMHGRLLFKKGKFYLFILLILLIILLYLRYRNVYCHTKAELHFLDQFFKILKIQFVLGLLILIYHHIIIIFTLLNFLL